MTTEEWITDDDGHEYYRLKYDNLIKIKTEIGKILKVKSKKYKRMDSEAHEKLKVVKKYIEDDIIPTIGLKSNTLYTQEDLDKLFIIGEEYNLIKKPEIGSCLIFEINQNNNLSLTGISKEFYEATTKILLKSQCEKKEALEVNNLPNKVQRKKCQSNKKRKYTPKKPEPSMIMKKLELKRNLKLRLKRKYEDNKIISSTKQPSSDKNIEQIQDNKSISNEINIDQRGVYNSYNSENRLIKKDYRTGDVFKTGDNRKKRKRKRKHKRYIRNSTIITINKVNKDTKNADSMIHN
jgi:hypothetical protein